MGTTTDDDGQPMFDLKPLFVGLPARPHNWRAGPITLDLERHEADFLKRKLSALRRPNDHELSLLARLVRTGVAATDSMWSAEVGAFAGPTFAQFVHRHHVVHSLAFVVGRQKFFEAISLSAAMSSIDSARSRFSLLFSASSVRSRWASDTVIPPNLALYL